MNATLTGPADDGNAGGTGDGGDDGDGGADGGGGTGGADDGGVGESGGADDGGDGNAGDSAGDSADGGSDGGPAGACDLGMDVAIKVDVDVSWDGGIAVLAGSGTISTWILGTLDPNGTDVHLTGQVCRLSLPDFATGALAGNETYGTLFPDAIWNAPAMPTIDAHATVSSADPGATLELPDGAVVLGAQLADPLNDPWPADWSGLDAADHDGDGDPGITSVAKTGGSYAYPRIDILNSSARAQALFIASRTIMSFDGTIDSCDGASGSASLEMENHALGCRVLGGGNCSSGQTTTLDGNLPVFQIQGGSFALSRLSDGASCQDVFAAQP